MTYAIFLLVTAVCAFGLNYLTNKICSGTGMINQSGGSNVHALRCITSFLLLLVLTLASCQTCRDQSGSRVCCTGEFHCISHSLYRCKFQGKTEIKKQRKKKKLLKRIIHDIASYFPS